MPENHQRWRRCRASAQRWSHFRGCFHIGGCCCCCCSSLLVAYLLSVTIMHVMWCERLCVRLPALPLLLLLLPALETLWLWPKLPLWDISFPSAVVCSISSSNDVTVAAWSQLAEQSEPEQAVHCADVMLMLMIVMETVLCTKLAPDSKDGWGPRHQKQIKAK